MKHGWNSWKKETITKPLRLFGRNNYTKIARQCWQWRNYEWRFWMGNTSIIDRTQLWQYRVFTKRLCNPQPYLFSLIAALHRTTSYPHWNWTFGLPTISRSHLPSSFLFSSHIFVGWRFNLCCISSLFFTLNWVFPHWCHAKKLPFPSTKGSTFRSQPHLSPEQLSARLMSGPHKWASWGAHTALGCHARGAHAELVRR